jgi:hypothetical protein
VNKSKIEGIEVTKYWRKETKNETFYTIKYSLPGARGSVMLASVECKLQNNKLVLRFPDVCYTKEFLEYKDELMEYINDFMKFPLIIGVPKLDEDEE